MTGINQIGRAGINYRSQWPSLSGGFETFSFYFDYNFEDYHSSVGLLLLRDNISSVKLNSTMVGLSYAYHLRLAGSWIFRPGIQFSYLSRNLDFSKLVFGDQLGPSGQVIRAASIESFQDAAKANLFDLNLGGIFYNSNFWVGGSVYHVTRPNQSLSGGTSRLNPRISIHGGYQFLLSSPARDVEKKRYWGFTPSLNFRHQGNYDQMDVGIQFILTPILFGAWYRGLPFKKIEGIATNEAAVVMIGMIIDRTTLGYSYDYTLSELGIQAGGAHELSLTITFSFEDPRKPPLEKRLLACPIPMGF